MFPRVVPYNVKCIFDVLRRENQTIRFTAGRDVEDAVSDDPYAVSSGSHRIYSEAVP